MSRNTWRVDGALMIKLQDELDKIVYRLIPQTMETSLQFQTDEDGYIIYKIKV